MALKIGFITIDCADTKAQAEFWSQALGYEIKGADEKWAQLADSAGGNPGILFQAVPEGKPGKNRLHFDLNASDLQAEAKRLQELGAGKAEGYEELESLV